jgi:hypothetical protein
MEKLINFDIWWINEITSVINGVEYCNDIFIWNWCGYVVSNNINEIKEV